MFLQEILEEVFRELHKVRDEIVDGMFTLVQIILLNQSDHLKRKSPLNRWRTQVMYNVDH